MRNRSALSDIRCAVSEQSAAWRRYSDACFMRERLHGCIAEPARLAFALLA
jgi:hypothetical protein